VGVHYRQTMARPRTSSGRPRSTGSPRLTYLVKRLELALRAELDDIVAPYGITTLQYTALSVLALDAGISSAQMGRRSFVSPQAANAMVASLAGKGLIERQPSPHSRRALAIFLTDEGRSTLRAVDREVDRLEAKMLEPLSEAERAAFRDALTSSVEHLRG
jgi:DNA-binding MarR family transcriptional regulator